MVPFGQVCFLLTCSSSYNEKYEWCRSDRSVFFLLVAAVTMSSMSGAVRTGLFSSYL